MIRNRLRAAFGLFCLFAAAAISLAAAPATASPVSASVGTEFSQASPTLGNPPTGLKSENADGTNLSVSWKAPALSANNVTGYILRLDDTVVAQYGILNGVTATHGLIPISRVTKGGILTVSAQINLLQEGPRSAGITLAPVNLAGPVPPPGTQPAPLGQSGPIFGGGIPNPPIYLNQTNPNNPDALEAYGMKDGFTKIIDTLGKSPGDLSDKGPNGMAGGYWQASVFLLLSGMVFLAWTISLKTYELLTSAVLVLIASFTKSDLFIYVGIAGLAAFAWWGAYHLGRDKSRIYKAAAYVLVIMAVGTLYVADSGKVIENTILAPTKASQVGIVLADTWKTEGSSEADYNLSIKPTYNGDALEQGMRRHANQTWLRYGYSGYCMLNFGNVEWSITNRVPDKHKGWEGYTFCEYLLRAQTLHNAAALDRLRSHDGTAGIGGDTGYVEAASKEVWEFYQGHQPWTRLFYSWVAFGSQVMLTPLTWGQGFMNLTVEILLACDAVLLAVWLAAGSYPDFRKKVIKHAKSMGHKTILPAMLSVTILVFLKIQDAVFSLMGPSSWLWGSIVRSGCTFLVISYGVWRVVNFVISKVKQSSSPQVSHSGFGNPSQQSDYTSSGSSAGSTPQSTTTPQPISGNSRSHAGR